MSTATLTFKVIKVHKVNNGKTRAFVDICIDDAIVIKGLRVIDGPNGLFVAMPSNKSKKDEKYYETVFCTTTEVKDDLSNTVLAAYKNE